MKKLISLLLALVMVMSLSVTAFASGQDADASFVKEYQIKHGTAPAEEFQFTVAYTGYSYNGTAGTPANKPTVTLTNPKFDNLSATASAAAGVAITNVANADLGVYTYVITETAGTTAGVTYNSGKLYLVVTITRDEQSGKHHVAAVHYTSDITSKENKTGKLVNSYDAGSLRVTKAIKGNMAVMDKKFTFTITLNAPQGISFNDSVQNLIDKGTAVRTGSTVTITVALGDGDSINITNIPAGTTYTITEDAEGYVSANTTAADGSIAGGDADVSLWTNTLDSEIDMGVSMDAIPYILLLGVCAMAAVLFVTKRRRVEF